MQRFALTAVALIILGTPAGAAERKFGISGFDRIRVDGNFRVTVKTGVAPFARASGDIRALDAVAIRVDGRTLIIRPAQSRDWGGYPGEARGPVAITIGTHELSAVQLNGSGALAIDRVEGLKFDAVAVGAGALSIDEVAVDQLTVALAGSATGRLGGKAGALKALVRGSATLDSEGLATRDLTLGADGPATVRLTASETAKVTASGVAAVALGGSPACTLTVSGSAEVSGCRVRR